MTLWKGNCKGMGGGVVKTKRTIRGGMDIFWNHIKNYTFQLRRLEVSARSQIFNNNYANAFI